MGSTATLSCVSDSDATMIEWLIGNAQLSVTTSSRTLDYELNPVTDDLHENTLTCRVTRTARTAEQTIFLTVIGESELSLSLPRSLPLSLLIVFIL